MQASLSDWVTVVDRRARFTWAVGLVLAACVSVVEIIGAAAIVAALRLVTEPAGATIRFPLIGDIEARLPGSDRVADLRWLAVIATAFFAARGALVLTQLYVLYRSSFAFGVRLCDRVTASLLERPYAWHLQHNSSELASLATVVTQQFVVSVFTPAQAAGAHLLVILAIAGTAIAVEPVGTVTAAVALAFIVAMTLWLTQRRLLELGAVDVSESTRVQRLASESLGAIREVKLLDLSVALRRGIWESRWRWASANRQRSTIVAVPRIVIETFSFSGLLLFFAIRGEVGGDALAAAGVLGYAVIRLLPTTNNLITSLNTARGAQASMGALASALREQHRVECADTQHGSYSGELEVRVVDLNYTWPNGAEVLKGVNLRLRPGASLGIVGRTGSGKSTLLDLMCGLLEPTSGEVLVGHTSIRGLRPWWYRQIGVVPQIVTLLDDTVVANIALGISEAEIDPDRLRRAIHLAQLDELIDGLPDGIRTHVGERGVRLSGGQRQRLAIARALYRDPPLIVLDEGTSALDSLTEHAVIRALRSDRPGRSLVMVAHRLSTLVDCDEIIVLEDGLVAARGTYAVLMRTDERFRQLAAAAAR